MSRFANMRSAFSAFAAVGIVAGGLVIGSGARAEAPAASANALIRGDRTLASLKAEHARSLAGDDRTGTRAARPADVNSPDAATAFGGSTKIQAGDGASGDQFGGSVGISGTTVIIGANANAAASNRNGAAYVYVLGSGGWTLQQKLTPPDGESDDAFGSYVAISGDTAVVGAYGNRVGTNVNQGSAYVFVRSGSTWTFQQQLTASDGAANDIFGRSVAIAGDTIVVGAASADLTTSIDQGAAYVFVRSGSTWAQQAKLTASDGAALDYFGDSVAISGNSVIVGATEDAAGTNLQQGSAYVFTRSGSTWSQQAKITAADGTAFDYFGFSVSIDGDTAAIGTLQDVGASFQQGSVYVYTRSGSTWTQQQKLLAVDGAAGDSFGNSVFIQGDTLMIGAAGDTNGTNARQGSAYVFGRASGVWTQSQKLVANDGAAEDSFGAGVAFTTNNAIVGSIGDTIGSNSLQGSAYIFSTDVTITGRVTTPGGQNLRNAVVSMVDSAGVRRTATTSSFGVYSFDNVRTGETYTLTVASKRYRFTPRVTAIDSAMAIDFVGQE